MEWKDGMLVKIRLGGLLGLIDNDRSIQHPLLFSNNKKRVNQISTEEMEDIAICAL